MSDRWTVEALKRLGLTEYEAKAYMALNLIKAGTVSDIHLSSGVPRSAVYGALAKLEEKGLIDVEQCKPMRYRSVAPSKAVERLRGALEEDSEKVRKHLEEAHARAEGQAPAEAVWTIRGAMNLYNKLSEMIGEADESIIFIATDPTYFNYQELYPIFGNIMEMIKKKAGDGVRIRFVCTDRAIAAEVLRELPDIEVRLFDPAKPSSAIPLTGGVLMADDCEALISLMDTKLGGKEVAAVHTRLCSIVSVLRHFSEVEWDSALPL